MSTESYRHTQFGWPVVVILGATTAIIGALTLTEGAGFAFLIVTLASVSVGVNFAWLTVSVDDTYVRLRFGVGLIRKRFALSDIRSCQVVRTEWYHGTGIRMVSDGWLYSVAGRMTVQLDLPNGTRALVGSNEPEELLAAIQSAAGVGAPTGSSDTSGGPGFKWVALILLPVFITIGVGFYYNLRAPRVVIGAEVFSVRSGFYKSEIPIADIAEVVVSDSLPRIRARTDGFAFGSARRGHFRLDSLGAGMLFLDRGYPPYVIIRTADRYVIVGYKDYTHTRGLIEGLAKIAAP